MAQQAGTKQPLEAGVAVGAETPAGGAETDAKHKPLRPHQCRRHLRRAIAQEYGAIVEGFVQAAKNGSCQHVRLATELMDSGPRRKGRSKGSLQRMVEKLPD